METLFKWTKGAGGAVKVDNMDVVDEVDAPKKPDLSN